MRKAAEEIGERPVLAKKRDSGKIILERVNLEKLVAEQTKINGATHDELTLELARCKQTATEAIEQVEALSEFIAVRCFSPCPRRLLTCCDPQAIGQAIESRRNRWNQFRTAIASRAKAAFIRNLEHRGFSGKLIFDHVDNLLRIKVQTDSIAGMKKDAKALSGGEKSFSTICLLMTLWEAVGSPIRCLDEFVSPLFVFLCSALISTFLLRMSSWSVSAFSTMPVCYADVVTLAGRAESKNLGRNDGPNGSRR